MGTHAPTPHYNNSNYEQLFSHSPTRDPYYQQHESDPEDADDERSFSEIDDDDLIYRRRHRFHPNTFGIRRNSNCTPQFLAQDVRPTSVKELAGWYSYAWAAEVFVVCGIGSFIPVTLEQLARENGVLLGENGVTGGKCGASEHGGVGERGDAQCVVNILGWWINTASFAMYTFSVSVLIQSLVIISMSGAADHGSYRKKLLLVFALIGSISTMLFVTVTPRFFLFGAVWAILGNVGFGASFVLLNAFLPVLVRHHPSLLFKSPPPTPLNEGNALLPSTAAPTTYSAENSPVNGSLNGTADSKPKNPALTLSSQISSYGIAIGYCGAVLMQTFGILLVISTGSLQLVLFFVGLWWFIFSIPAALWLRPRPGPPLPRLNKDGSVWATHGNGNGNAVNGGVVGSRGGGSDGGNWRYIAFAWKSLWKTTLRARRLKDVVLFLAAWFMISDGIATVSGTAILFAKTNLHMEPAAVAFISVISTLFGVLGAFAWSRFSPYFGVSPSRTILILIAIFELIPLYGLLGFIPAVQRWGVIGLTQPYEMYMLGGVYGFVLGGISGYCRSVFGELIPPGSEAAFYALYAITDKGSSIFGPAVVGYMTDKFGNIRCAFWFLAVLLAVPLPLLAMVDVDRGKKEGRQLAEEELRGLGLRDEEFGYGNGPHGVYGADGVIEEEEQDLEDGHGRGRDGYQGVSEWVLSEPSGVSGGSGGSAGEEDGRIGRGSSGGRARGYR